MFYGLEELLSHFYPTQNVKDFFSSLWPTKTVSVLRKAVWHVSFITWYWNFKSNLR